MRSGIALMCPATETQTGVLAPSIWLTLAEDTMEYLSVGLGVGGGLMRWFKSLGQKTMGNVGSVLFVLAVRPGPETARSLAMNPGNGMVLGIMSL
jgi:hypothetical protein